MLGLCTFLTSWHTFLCTRQTYYIHMHVIVTLYIACHKFSYTFVLQLRVFLLTPFSLVYTLATECTLPYSLELSLSLSLKLALSATRGPPAYKVWFMCVPCALFLRLSVLLFLFSFYCVNCFTLWFVAVV